MDTSQHENIPHSAILEMKKTHSHPPLFQEELLHQNILLQLDAASPASLTLDIILKGIHVSSTQVSAEQVEKALNTLREKGLIEIQAGALNASIKRYKLSPLGQHHTSQYVS
jgi:Fe2+ or Zn2+ uptake regulation protein